MKKKPLPVPTGPWSSIDSGFEVKAKLKRNKTLPLVIPDSDRQKYIDEGKPIPDHCEILGVYRNRDISLEENEVFEVSINIVLDGVDVKELILKNGIDKVLSASEKSLNGYVVDGVKLLGDIAITELVSDNSSRPDLSQRFISCRAKTNKGDIKKFLGTDSGKLKVF